MTDDRVRVSRTLYRTALDLAIEWQSSLLETHNFGAREVSCCKPENRCEIWKTDRKLLGELERARKHLGRDFELPG